MVLLLGVRTYRRVRAVLIPIFLVLAAVLYFVQPPLAQMERDAEDSVGAGGDTGVSPTKEGNELAESIKDKLLGRSAVTAPSTLTQGEKAPVVVRVATGEYPGDIRGTPGPTDPTLAADAAVQAKLQGDAFVIVPISSERQELLNDRPTEWTWDVAAKDSGPTELILTISVVVRRPDGLRDLPIKRLPISVTPDFAYAAKRLASTIGPSLLTGASGFLAVIPRLLALLDHIRQRRRDIDSSAKKGRARRVSHRSRRNR